MGKVRTEAIKRVSRNLYSRYPTYFTPVFQENREKLRTILVDVSKGVRNRVAGYVTRIVRVKMKESEGGERGGDEQESFEDSG
ncbi:MAG: 30S ribosomal protein S17e [Promethearchaeati archaeon SRVP18_Atabeyarchaeia-1]